MREYSFIYEEGLSVGLIPSEKIKRGVPGLLEAYNVRIEKEGVLPYTPIVDPFIDVPASTWPFPQVFNTKRGIIVATQTALYSVDDNYVLTSLISGQQPHDIWSLADYDLYQIWTNGLVTLIRDTTTGLFGSIAEMTHTIESVCDYNGQLIAGGLGSDRENWVAWSDIGSATLTTLISEIGSKNVKGFMPMGFRGSVQTVKKLGKGVVVYGTTGISYIFPASTTYGKNDIIQYGIPGKSCVGGDDNIHLFVDVYGYLHTLDASLKHTVLGYSNYMANLQGEIVISFDPLRRTFYISDGSICYMLVNGMSEIYQCPSGIVRVGAELLGTIYHENEESAYITTNSFDILTRGIKTIQTVEASIHKSGAQGAIDYAYSSSEIPTRSMLKNLNKSGIFTPIVSGVDFGLHIESSSYVDFSIDSMVVRYKMSDKRSIRGPYGEQRNL